MTAVMMGARVTPRVDVFLSAHPYASEFVVDEEALRADGASVAAFKAYLDDKLLHEGVDRLEEGARLFYGVRMRVAQEAAESLGWSAVDLEYQPWFDRYFSRVVAYEAHYAPQDVLRSLDMEKARGWVEIQDPDDFYPKR